MKKFKIMSKLKNAELEESALEVAGKVLALIDAKVDKMMSCEKGCDKECINDLKKLTDAYNTLKPYF